MDKMDFRIGVHSNLAALPQYPQPRYRPSPLVDLSLPAERERLSPAAVAAFFNMMAKWKVADAQARQLLGGISSGSYYNLKKDPSRTLDEDRLRRVSYLIGIFKSLNILYSEELADRWISLPNRNRIFQGRAPLDLLLRGGIPAFELVRRLLDARRGGM